MNHRSLYLLGYLSNSYTEGYRPLGKVGPSDIWPLGLIYSVPTHFYVHSFLSVFFCYPLDCLILAVPMFKCWG